VRICAGLLVSAAFGCAQLASTVSLSNGVQVEISANLGQPTGQQTITAEMTRASGDSFYRIFRDQNHLAVYAYELQIALTPDGNALRAVAKPVETEFAARFPDADAGKPVPTRSADQEVGPLGSGQSATIDLFEIPGMGIHLTETIRVRFGAEGGGALRFSALRVSIDGKPVAGPASGSVAGRYVMFYLPGRGAYFFSTEPVAGRGFAKTGTIDRERMRFTVDNAEFECVSGAPIHGEGGELWVLHDASYQPEGNWTRSRENPGADEFFMAASDSLGWWLR